MPEPSKHVSRRQLLSMIGKVAGGSAMYQAMSSLGYAAESHYSGPVKLGNARPGASVLVLGAGGASRGILQPLLAERPGRLVIANRTPGKAAALAEEFIGLGEIGGCGFDGLAGESFDLILNATAASLSGALPPLPENILSPGGACYDLAYGKQPTAFVRWGESLGAALSVDGIGMLVEQAAEAFFIWRGLYPQTQPVIDLLNMERGQGPTR